MSTGTLCLRCRKYYVADFRERTSDHCRCVRPVPSEDGKVPVGYPDGFDWRLAELANAVGLRHASWCPIRSNAAYGCFCGYGRKAELSDPRPDVVEEAVARALWRIDQGGLPLATDPPEDVMDDYRTRARGRLSGATTQHRGRE